jgi:hypothetical protein
MQIIGFAGLAQAGKTTAATMLAKDIVDRGFLPVMEHFAGPLKQASEILGFRKGGEWDHLYREFCQFAGQKARSASDDWWVDRFNERVALLREAEVSAPADAWHERVIIIDDLRYPNEVAAVKRLGGLTCFIDGLPRLTDLDAEWRKHESERMATEYSDGKGDDELFDYSMPNAQNLTSLEEKIKIMSPYWTSEIAEERLRD